MDALLQSRDPEHACGSHVSFSFVAFTEPSRWSSPFSPVTCPLPSFSMPCRMCNTRADVTHYTHCNPFANVKVHYSKSQAIL